MINYNLKNKKVNKSKKLNITNKKMKRKNKKKFKCKI